MEICFNCREEWVRNPPTFSHFFWEYIPNHAFKVESSWFYTYWYGGTTWTVKIVIDVSRHFLIYCCSDIDSFHLCLFDFPFICQFYSIMITLVKSTFWNTADHWLSNHFINISNFFDKVCYLKRNVAFAPISFVVQWNVISNDNIQSFQLSVELLF